MLKRWLWSINRKILVPILFLKIISIITILRISTAASERFHIHAIKFFFKHILLVCVAIFFIFFFSNVKKEKALRWGDRIFIISLMLTFVTPVLATKINGVRRWIRIFGFTLQSSELLKTFIVFPISFLLEKEKYKESIGAMMFCVFLCAIQPDLGMSFLIACNCFTLFFVQGKNLHIYLSALGVIGVTISLSGIFLAKYAYKRLLIFFGKQQGFQISRALLSVANSKLIGEGKYIYIPDSHCDFIFTEICNYFGILVGIFVIFVPIVLFNEVQNQLETLTHREQLVVIGLSMQIVIQTYFHVLSNLAFIPTKGVSLPMISVGGSNLITHGLSIGLLLSILKVEF